MPQTLFTIPLIRKNGFNPFAFLLLATLRFELSSLQKNDHEKTFLQNKLRDVLLIIEHHDAFSVENSP